MTMGLLKLLPKVAIGGASVAAAIYLLLSPRVAIRWYSNALFHPHRYPSGDWDVDLDGIKPEDVWFRAKDNSQLHGWFFQAPGATHTVLFSHGNTGNMTGRPNLVRLLLQCGLSVFIYDYRGYGRSDGRPSIPGICEDGIAAYDYLTRERRLKTEDIILYGESLGCAVSCQIADLRPCAGMILQSGFASLRKIGCDHIPFVKMYPNLFFPRPLLDSGAVLERFNQPLLMIHGAQDPVVPFVHAEYLYSRACEPKTLVKVSQATHSDIWYVAPDQYVSAIKQFVTQLK
jgi:uncharacterized protein